MVYDIKVMNASCGNYTVGEKISAGTYGVVYRAKNKRNGQTVAIKFASKVEGRSTLLNEARIMIHLQRTIPLPRIRDYGKHTSDINYIVMDLLGLPLYYDNVIALSVDEEPAGRMSVSLLDICIQVLNIMQRLHHSGFVYRDVKPSNFLFGMPPNHRMVHLIDLGFVKRIQDITKKATPVGTNDYMSIDTHEGYEQCRRDDLESLAYLFYYMHCGSLPWTGLTEHTEFIREKKQNNEFRRNCPANVANYLKHVRDIERNESPHYQTLRNVLSYLVIF